MIRNRGCLCDVTHLGCGSEWLREWRSNQAIIQKIRDDVTGAMTQQTAARNSNFIVCRIWSCLLHEISVSMMYRGCLESMGLFVSIRHPSRAVCKSNKQASVSSNWICELRRYVTRWPQMRLLTTSWRRRHKNYQISLCALEASRRFLFDTFVLVLINNSSWRKCGEQNRPF